jgi:hypothetical protein
MIEASPEHPLETALASYEHEAQKLSGDEKSAVIGLIGQARTLGKDLQADANSLSALLAKGANPSDANQQATFASRDDAIESKEKRLRTVVSQIQTKLGLTDDAEMQKARRHFGNRLFTAKLLAPVIEKAESTASKRVSKWKQMGKIFKLASRGEYSFDPAKASLRERSMSNRRKYGYVNPSKKSAVGLEILSKGIRRDLFTAAQTKEKDVDWHVKYARYHTTSSRGSAQNFGFGESILGHHDDCGASDHWNQGKRDSKPGHMWPRDHNLAWNQKADSYQGPEHWKESAASGHLAARYIVPSEAIGSHSSWW